MSTSGPAAAPATLDRTKEMADLLQSIARGVDPGELTWVVNEERAAMLKKQLEAAKDPQSRGTTWLSYTLELLNAGKTRQALDELDRLETFLKGGSAALTPENEYALRQVRGIAWLRLGEEENCCARNTGDSCLIPIRGKGVHALTSGSTHAMREYEAILRDHPDDPQARWLLNVAAMTLGKYPQGVAPGSRISPKALESGYDIKRFPNIAPEVGLDLLGLAGGAVVDDLDGDGYLDVMVSGAGFRDQLRFFHNNGDATFTERTREAKLTGETGGLNLIQADYDNDGRTDILVLRGGWMGKAGRFPPSLLHNEGDGTFTDVTRKAGLMATGPTQTAVFFDYDDDGFLDLFVGYESLRSCILYHNNRDGTFSDVSERAGVGFRGFVKGVVSADYDNDGLPDLFLSAFGRKVLYHNDGGGTFRDVTSSAGISGPSRSFGTFFFDYDNDGWADLFVMDYDLDRPDDVLLDLQGLPVEGERSRLYRNNHDGTFTDVSKATRLDRILLGMGLNFGDLDNDGYLDIYAGTGTPLLTALIPNRMFRNAGGKVFQEVTTSGGFGHLQKGHGVAFADLNNDGEEDVFEQMGGAYSGDVAYSALYANPGHGNRWITLKLEGTKANRGAIGARIKVVVKGSDATREIYRTVGSGASFGCNPLRQEIGLGKARSLESVEITWPVSRRVQTLRGLKMDAFYAVREDRDEAVPIELKATPWPKAIASARAARTSHP